MTPPVLSAALSGPIKLIDSLDHNYPPENVLIHLSARVTLQLVPQPLNNKSRLTCHSRRMSHLHCSLTGTASSKSSKYHSILKNTHTMLILKPSLLLKSKTKMSDTMPKNSKLLLNKTGIFILYQLSIPNAMKRLLSGLPKKFRRLW